MSIKENSYYAEEPIKEKGGEKKKKYTTLTFIKEQPKPLRFFGFKSLTVNILYKMWCDHGKNCH